MQQADDLIPTDPIPNQSWHYADIQDGGITDDSTTSILFRIICDSTSKIAQLL